MHVTACPKRADAVEREKSARCTEATASAVGMGHACVQLGQRLGVTRGLRNANHGCAHRMPVCLRLWGHTHT